MKIWSKKDLLNTRVDKLADEVYVGLIWVYS